MEKSVGVSVRCIDVRFCACGTKMRGFIKVLLNKHKAVMGYGLWVVWCRSLLLSLQGQRPKVVTLL